MARKRRKRRPDPADPPVAEASLPAEVAPHDPVVLDPVGPAPQPALDTPDLEDGAPRVSDRSCLSHPSYDLEQVCDDCAVGMCPVCAIGFGASRLCADCFEVRVHRRRRGGSWHGWVALATGLFAIGAVVAPFTLAVDPEIARAFPGGRAFFIYGSSVAAAMGVFFGLGSQDYNGLGKRAGIVGVGLGCLAFCAILVMNVVVAFGTKG